MLVVPRLGTISPVVHQGDRHRAPLRACQGETPESVASPGISSEPMENLLTATERRRWCRYSPSWSRTCYSILARWPSFSQATPAPLRGVDLGAGGRAALEARLTATGGWRFRPMRSIIWFENFTRLKRNPN